MADEGILRFVAVRPVAGTLGEVQRERQVALYEEDEITEFYKVIRDAIASDASDRELVEFAQQFKSSDRYVSTVAGLPEDAIRLIEWFQKNENQPLHKINLADIPDIDQQSLRNVVADSLLADALDDINADDSFTDGKILLVKILSSLRGIRDKKITREKELIYGKFIAGTTVTFPNFLSRRPLDNQDHEQDDETEDKDPELEKRRRLANLHRAHRELADLTTDAGSIEVSEISTKSKPEISRTRTASNNTLLQSEIRFAASAREKLSNEAVEGLKTLRFDLKNVEPTKAVGLIEREMDLLSSELSSEFQTNRIVTIGGISISEQALRTSLNLAPYPTQREFNIVTEPGLQDLYLSLISTCEHSVGVGDLLIAKQTIKAYELGEFAHVENVLAGETREREHRRLNRQEDVFTFETIEETEKERDLQSTERSELQNEAEKTIRSEFGLEAGLQVSGSYGPTVSFNANLGTSFSTTIEESKRKASTFAREVVEKSSERIRQQVREEQVRRLIEEIEERNLHKVENSVPTNGHIRGIYRWLNKIYDAQVFRYGQRMMFEFVVPEPAAFFLYALVQNPPADMVLEEPTLPTYPVGGGSPLKPSNLSRTNYQDYLSKFGVTNAPEPPPEFTAVSYSLAQDRTGNEPGGFGRATKLTIPKGYEAYSALLHGAHTLPEGESNSYFVMLGGRSVNFTFWGSTYQNITRTQGELSIAVKLRDVFEFTLGIDVYCQLTSEGFAKWQHEVYEAIMQAYLQQKAEYEEELRTRAIQEGIRILGRNPLENRRIEQDELKKHVIHMMTGGIGLGLNAFQLFGGEPIINIPAACSQGKYIQFIENAFEWRNMLYVFYPYFWGRKARWISALHMTDPDPDFAAFLKSGAARVQVPVRPGFEKAIAYFCQTGHIWNGSDVPVIGDDLYVPIIQEITENLGAEDEGVPYPEDSEPWEVTIPTSLVLIQDLEEIPGIRDVLTDETVDLRNENA